MNTLNNSLVVNHANGMSWAKETSLAEGGDSNSGVMMNKIDL